MVDHSERVVPVRGGELSIGVLEGGNGAPLVFLHGLDGLQGWTTFLDRLGGEHRVYAPYHPGVGLSEGLERLDDLWDLVLFYEELLDALGIEKTTVIGHSYGGMVAAELAAHCPHRVGRLVLVSAMGLWLDNTPVTDYFVLSAEEMKNAAWYDPGSEDAKAFVKVPEDPEERAEYIINRAKTLSSVGKFCWPIPDRGLRKRIHRITAPTLTVWGASDGIVPAAYGEEFRRLIPGSRLEVLDRCAHYPHRERPDQFHSVVSQFLNAG